MERGTDRRKVYRRTDDLYRKSIEELKDYAIFMIDGEGRVVTWNKGAERILHYTEDEIVGKSAKIFWTEEDQIARKPEEEMQLAALHGRAEDERWHVRADQSRFWVSGVLSAVRDENGILLGFTKVMRDLTESKVLESERDRFFTLSMDLLCIVRLDGFFERVNPAFQIVFGYSEQELLSRTLFDFLHPDDKTPTELQYIRLRKGEPTKHLENRFRCKDGGFRWIAWSYFPEVERGVAYGVGRDTTDVRLMNEALIQRAEEQEQANRLKNEFLATLSHELRTPLTSILGWARLLRTRRLSESETERAIQVVERQALAQSKLIEDLLDVSRIITGKLRIDFQPVALAAIVDDVINEFRPPAEAKNLKINSRIDPAAGPIMGDPSRMQQIVSNLLSNAIKFTNEGGIIDVELARVDSHAQLQVRDTGIGIVPSVLPYVFEQFRQADSSDVRKHSGLGLGLAIVQHLVTQQRGTVSAESPGEGHGSTFTVEFPLAATEVLPSREGPIDLFSEEAQRVLKDPELSINDPSILRDIHVLLVEDEADTRDLLTTMMVESGARVTAVQSASEALNAIASDVPDILVSDIGMPKESGYELIRKIRAMDSAVAAIPAIALTAYAGNADRRRALVAGFHIHLAKPVEPDELLAVIRSFVRRNEQSQMGHSKINSE